MNVTALTPRTTLQGGTLAMWDREQLDVIKTLICPGASDAELALFGQVCSKTGLDPFSRQIYGLMRSQRQQVNGEWKTVEKLSIQTSIDGFRLIAERSGKYGGQVGPQWCGQDGVWRDVWLDHEYPAAARVGVIRTDWREPLYAVARWDSFVQTYKDRQTRQDVVGTMWQRMPDVMLAKVAESLALRRAFPAELSGLYTSEEMQQAENSAPRAETGPRVRDIPATPPDDEYPNLTAQLAKDPDAPQPAGAAFRARFDAQWAKGVARAVACGLPPHDAPPPDASADGLRAAQKELLEAITGREALNTACTERMNLARSFGADINAVDPAQMTTAEVNEVLATCDRILDAAEAAQPADESEAPF
jgi:phage recombination protein Bet